MAVVGHGRRGIPASASTASYRSAKLIDNDDKSLLGDVGSYGNGRYRTELPERAPDRRVPDHRDLLVGRTEVHHLEPLHHAYAVHGQTVADM